MKTFMLLATLTFSVSIISAQEKEFTIHGNGLIYDASTMSRLSHIVDSMHVRFRGCEPQNYTSLPQGQATHFYLKGNIKQAREAMDKKISVEEFTRRFPEAAMEKKSWIVREVYTDYEDGKFIRYSSLPLRNVDQFSLHLPYLPAHIKTKGWVYNEEDDELNALFLNLEEQPLPFGYAQLVQYVDCMIDTTAQLYLTTESSSAFEEPSPRTKVAQFISLADAYEGEPQRLDWSKDVSEKQYREFSRELEAWNAKRMKALAIENKTGNAALEFYAERYLSAGETLQMKRMRRVTGTCSMDRSPRTHAASICKLAAETAQWDIFLRAHLDIMNDNFSRATDGSWAWKGRGTYLKELEELDIRATDLLLGTCLYAANVGDNHYYGDIGRIGRALSETSNKNALENRLLIMIQDLKLDRFNRLLMAYVFDNYNRSLKDNDRKQTNQSNFLKAVASLPDNIGESFKE